MVLSMNCIVFALFCCCNPNTGNHEKAFKYVEKGISSNFQYFFLIFTLLLKWKVKVHTSDGISYYQGTCINCSFFRVTWMSCGD